MLRVVAFTLRSLRKVACGAVPSLIAPLRSGAVLKTIPVMLRLDPADWRKFQQVARERDLMPAQLIRQVMKEWLEKAGKKKC